MQRNVLLADQSGPDSRAKMLVKELGHGIGIDVASRFQKTTRERGDCVSV